jgi:hypothetical protein
MEPEQLPGERCLTPNVQFTSTRPCPAADPPAGHDARLAPAAISACMSGACSELVGSGVHMLPICAHRDQRCRRSVVNACCGVSKMRPQPGGRHLGDGERDGIAAAQVEGAAAVTAQPHLLLYWIAGHRRHCGGDEHPVRGHVDGRVAAVGGWCPRQGTTRARGTTNPESREARKPSSPSACTAAGHRTCGFGPAARRTASTCSVVATKRRRVASGDSPADALSHSRG